MVQIQRRREREHTLQVIRIRGGVSRRQHPGADHILDGTDKPDLVAAGLQHRLEHAGGGGFPVGAGDPHHMQLFRRPAEPVGAHKRPGPAGREPDAIIRDILAGLRDTGTPYEVVENRTQAIRFAMKNARPGDIVLLAGKGHETYQILADGVIHLDEREVVAEALKEE